MNRKQTSLAVLGAILLVPALLTGCSAKGDSTAPASTGASAGGGSAVGGAGSAERIAAIGKCMRAAGFDFDDSAGAQIAPPEGVEPDAWASALQQCASEIGGGEAAKPIGGDPEQDAALAECLTKAGLPDVPESQADFGPWVEGLSAADQQTFDDSIGACSSEVAGAGR